MSLACRSSPTWSAVAAIPAAAAAAAVSAAAAAAVSAASVVASAAVVSAAAAAAAAAAVAACTAHCSAGYVSLYVVQAPENHWTRRLALWTVRLVVVLDNKRCQLIRYVEASKLHLQIHSHNHKTHNARV